jgi:hypothetical protein
MIWYASTCGITAMGLLYGLYDMVKCVCYMSLGSNGCFMADAAVTGGHYRINIINGVDYLRSDSIMLLLVCMVAYNIRGTGICI